ncbi:hypothetical protein DSO57_1005595 [Entomophthora muscae]|uniref:Uncharacterized protein n=1 Tax=Entomophthora muscae TaxID=34485 RepID=A0ACC2UTR0_9FUNG|nr:hypothetical protein DSO57_1005595 [Entomophthora muscae]
MGLLFVFLAIELLVIAGILIHNLYKDRYVNDACAPHRMTDATIAADTSGCYKAHLPLPLSPAMSWAGSAESFLTFHHDSPYKDVNFKYVREFAPLPTKDGEFYILQGCQKIAKIDCPLATGCFYSMTWKNNSWNIDKSLFPLQNSKLPAHIAKLNLTMPLLDAYHLMKLEPFHGHICFNRIDWGIKYVTNPSSTFDHPSETTFATSFLLPTNIPDGVVGFL